MICPVCGLHHGEFNTFWNAEDMLDGISEFDLDDEQICDMCYGIDTYEEIC